MLSCVSKILGANSLAPNTLSIFIVVKLLL